ncbi:ABC transporter permease [Terrisporobacter glycolicus]|uniref:ABC3 transporter permease C-terminal domain-containing protein n=1 Tax=Terrisporobacter glycolicus ATCC 14880 = DSM 1288 TaxID=1121315 RepID=A0ABZ2EUX1_9FIRM|nr:FtsX-like permease family protein [Terrisporobacter glycolicus]
MFKKIIINDIKNSKLVTLVTLLIVSLSSMLVSLAMILGFNLFGSIDTLMINAKTPHFMQMHSGYINMNRLNGFAKNNDLVDKYQVLNFLNIDGANIVINNKSLSNNVQDNGFSIQSETFDYLLDMDGNIIKVNDGEIYLPIYFLKDKLAKVGNKVLIKDKEFTVAGFLRDSQMNSLLASSKRYLVSENDYEKIKNYGNLEYLIEFRLKDLSSLSNFENDYINASLEMNGPTITYHLFKMINAISDGIMIAVILIVSILILLIAFLCIRFTLLAKIEDDYREIGVMKAIGLTTKDIKKIYLSKYIFISLTGCILGLILSLPLQSILLKNIRLSLGESNNGYMAPIFSVIGVCLIFLIIMFFINGILKKFKKISAAHSLHSSNAGEKTSTSKLCHINISSILGANIFMGIKDVFCRKKLYTTMLIILILSTFIVIVPQNLSNTISSRKFITYTGVGQCDMIINLQQTDNILEKSKDISSFMKNDKNIDRYSITYTKAFQVKNHDNSYENIKIDLGNHSIFPVSYYEGKEPTNDNEIALSSLNADKLNKNIGDFIILNINGVDKNLKICGIYSDITNGGETAKACFSTDLDEILSCTISAKMTNSSVIINETQTYLKNFNYAKVSAVDEYVNQTFGSTRDSIKIASNVSKVVAIFIAILITMLFLRMLIAKDKYSIAIMKSLGFTNRDLSIQYISRSIFICIIGIFLGVILSNTLGEKLAGTLIGSFGATTFKFIINPISTYLLLPIMLILSVIIASTLSTSSLEKIKISDNIKE